MAKKQPLPKRKKRFSIKVIKVVCGDCNVVMERWENPYDKSEEHFESRCPVCGMHIKAYEGSFHCIDENGRAYLEIKWNKDLDWKKEFLKKEIIAWENRKKQREEYDKIYESFEKADEDFDVSGNG